MTNRYAYATMKAESYVTQKGKIMAEDKIVPKHEQGDLSRDDVSALSYILQHVRGSSPSSVSPLSLDDIEV